MDSGIYPDIKIVQLRFNIDDVYLEKLLQEENLVESQIIEKTL